MSIAYQSWEIGSGPTVGYKIQGHQAAGDGLNFRKQQAESIPRSLTTLLYRQSQQQQQQQQQQPEAKPPVAAAPKFMPQTNNGVLMNGNPQMQRFATGAAAITSAATTTTAPSSPDRSRLSSSGSSRGAVVASVPLVAEAVQQNEAISNRPCSSSSSIVTSSISADSSDESDDKEVQSAFKGPLEQMDSLMTTLPRRGLSKFYAGKSRSFASLADVKSIKDLAKPDNPYNNKRRKCPSHRDGLDRHRFPVPRISTAAAGIAKKPISSSNATTLTLAVAMSTVGDGGDECDVSLVAGNPASIKRWQKSSRSLSLTDLQKA